MMPRLKTRHTHVTALLAASAVVTLLGGCTSNPANSASSKATATVTSHVLLVCNGSTSTCPRGARFKSLQAAVVVARPGDWILIWPGVYHEDDPAHHAGVWIETPGLHIRGLNRNTVVIDGSHGSSADPCPSSPALQNFAPRDGIVVAKASGVTIENLTVCNYLGGPDAIRGSQVWWTGTGAAEAAGSGASGSAYGAGDASVDGSGQLGVGAFSGSYLTATSMYHPAGTRGQHLAEFGIYAGSASGPGRITSSYASNMADGAFYVGACGRSCNTVLADDHGTGSATGYLGTNSGGKVVIESSTFDDNRAGIVLLSLNTDDLPPPQDGRCPASLTNSCTVIMNNDVTGNNNASAPAFGINPAIGVGVDVQGGSFDTITGNRISRNGAWGVLIGDNVDDLSSAPLSHCQGGIPNIAAPATCLFPARGTRVYRNRFTGNGSFGNATNGDIALYSLAPTPAAPRNCFYDNSGPGKPLTSSPARIQAQAVDGAPCSLPGTGANPAVFQQLGCADGGHCTVSPPAA
jgi:hypothetical protein